MLKLFVKYKSVLRFILIFLGSYFILSLFYNWYLDVFKSEVYYPDYVTHMVARQTEMLISSFGYAAQIEPHQYHLSMKLMINDQYLAQIVEGCNAMSIMVLFIAFILAFFGRLKTTLAFLLAGLVIIYAMNIIRIAILSIGIYEFPQHTEFLHTIIFPLIIYGTVFLLWILWVYIYSKNQAR
ncbi:MAG TPA: exosortase family protein XrtF [Salegentibacter sp.]|nr:exosortase family protein XrtF [Salegentibacter sp.]